MYRAYVPEDRNVLLAAFILIMIGGLLYWFVIDQWAFPILVIGFFMLMVTQCTHPASDAPNVIGVLNLSDVAEWSIWR